MPPTKEPMSEPEKKSEPVASEEDAKVIKKPEEGPVNQVSGDPEPEKREFEKEKTGEDPNQASEKEKSEQW